MNPISVALQGKGVFNLARRAGSIVAGYGLTPRKMNLALERLIAILKRYECSATFPVTAVALGRNPHRILEYYQQGIEFAIHGYRHIDHCQLSRAEQAAQLALAKQLFDRVGITARGFRGPYLHANSDTLQAAQQQGLLYDSSQGLAWDVLNGGETPAYRHVLNFYGALPVNDYPALPSLEGGLVRIPYSLPDDEALTHRLSLQGPAQMSALWVAVLRRSYKLGELFTLGLHPERAAIFQTPLTDVLSEARRLNPPVWIARLDEIAVWWRALDEAATEVSEVNRNEFSLKVNGPDGVTVLARNVETEAPVQPWYNAYRQVLSTSFKARASQRPFIGVSPASSPEVLRFVKQQGYIVETSEQAHRYGCYLHQPNFTPTDQRPLLTRIEQSESPLLRLGRWPNGARSALAITGDIDALTLQDYSLRLIGK